MLRTGLGRGRPHAVTARHVASQVKYDSPAHRSAPADPIVVLTEKEESEIKRWSTEQLTCGICHKKYYERENIGRWECVHKVHGTELDMYVRGDHRPLETRLDPTTTMYHSCTYEWREFFSLDNTLGPLVRKKSIFDELKGAVPADRIGALDSNARRVLFERTGVKDSHLNMRMVYRYDIYTATAIASLFEEYPKCFKRTYRFAANYRLCRICFVNVYEYKGEDAMLL